MALAGRCWRAAYARARERTAMSGRPKPFGLIAPGPYVSAMPTNKPLSERLMDCADARLAQARVARSDVAALKFAARALELIELAAQAQADETDAMLAQMEASFDAWVESYNEPRDEVEDGRRERREFYRNRDYGTVLA